MHVPAAGAPGRAWHARPGNPLRLLRSLEPWLAAGFLLLSLPIGVFWFVVLVALIAVDGVLAIAWVGIPILALAMMLGVAGAGATGGECGGASGR